MQYRHFYILVFSVPALFRAYTGTSVADTQSQSVSVWVIRNDTI